MSQALNLNNTEVAFRYKSTAQLQKAQFLFKVIQSPAITKIGSQLALKALQWKLPIEGLIRSTIFDQFCGGESLQDAARTAQTISAYNVNAILDYGVEGKQEEAEFDKAEQEFIKAIQFARQYDSIPFISLKLTALARFELLETYHKEQWSLDHPNPEWQKAYARLKNICQHAFNNQVKVLIDAEETWIQKPIDDTSLELMRLFNQQSGIIYNTYQMYCHAKLSVLKAHLSIAKADGFYLGAKIVRGAYMEKERERAQNLGYADPIQKDKVSTDQDYNLAIKLCLDNIDHTYCFFGTHNEYSCQLIDQLANEMGMSHNDAKLYISQLYGMSDNISFNLADLGFNVAKYLPYGPVKDVMPYLIRRAQENTSVSGQTSRELDLIQRELKRRKESK